LTRTKQITVAIFVLSIAAAFLFVYAPLCQKRPYLKIPLTFSLTGRPCIRSIIEGNSYLLELDTGASHIFTLNDECLNKIKKKKSGSQIKWYDIKDNEYLSGTYNVKQINVSNVKFFDPPVREEKKEFIFDGAYLSSEEKSLEEMDLDLKDWDEVSGRIGADALRIADYLIIDFQKHSIIPVRDIEKAKKAFCLNLETFTVVPLEDIYPCFVVKVKTDFGLKTFALDTGAWRTVLSLPADDFLNHQIVESNQFIFGDTDFGKTSLYLFKFPSHFESDGVLGRDFFRKHVVCLDFKNKRVLISPPIPAIDL
jgi:hypothetical protein